ncbi:transcriptional regulator, LysR family [Paraburkholderia susongensis]|uniref:Transcriptional regulator, LysR family n=2 Tax=Paraburkholderia susongensis TaxID=1515439 RepID=A0A1X7JFM8_9BURK|nr:transcriptional regulator, LysR family [Paraburkholderia susongensis]
MRIFVRVAEEGSFTAAAQRLDIATAAASRAVASLEAHLQARLLNRNTRRVVLTEAGERYLRRCEQILAYIDQAEAEAGNAQAQPSGRLRVHATTGFGQAYLVPAVMQYQKRYPSVSVELTLSQHFPDLLDEGYDVSLQLSSVELPDSGLISHVLGSVHSVLCAAPAYLREHGTPRNVAELAGHACLQLFTPVFPRDKWILEGSNGVETFLLPPATFQVNIAEALAGALREGVGIGALPMPAAVPALRNGSLLRVLPDYQLQKLTVYTMYASRQYLDAKIRTFVDFLKECIPQALAADDLALNLPDHGAQPG